MDTTIIAAVIGLGGVIVGALLQPFLAHKLTKKSALAVRVEAHNFKQPSFLSDSIEQYRDLRWNRNSPIKPPRKTLDELSFIRYSSQLLKVDLENKSNRSIEKIKIRLKRGGTFAFEIHDGDKSSKTKFDSVAEIDLINPSAKVSLYIWQRDSTSFFDKDETIISVTAYELDKVNIKLENINFSERFFARFPRGYLHTLQAVAFLAIIMIGLIGLLFGVSSLSTKSPLIGEDGRLESQPSP